MTVPRQPRDVRRQHRIRDARPPEAPAGQLARIRHGSERLRVLLLDPVIGTHVDDHAGTIGHPGEQVRRVTPAPAGAITPVQPERLRRDHRDLRIKVQQHHVIAPPTTRTRRAVPSWPTRTSPGSSAVPCRTGTTAPEGTTRGPPQQPPQARQDLPPARLGVLDLEPPGLPHARKPGLARVPPRSQQVSRHPSSPFHNRTRRLNPGHPDGTLPPLPTGRLRNQPQADTSDEKSLAAAPRTSACRPPPACPVSVEVADSQYVCVAGPASEPLPAD